MRVLTKNGAPPPEQPIGPTTHDRPDAGPHRGAAAGRLLITLAAVVVVIAGMKAAAPLLVPLLLAIFVAVICAPVFLAMQRRGVPSGLALLVLVALLAGLGVAVVGFVTDSLAGISSRAAAYEQALDSEFAQLRLWLEDHGVAVPETPLRGYLNLGALLRYFGPIAGTVTDLVIATFIIVIVAAFILLEVAAMPAKIEALPGFSVATWERIGQVVANVRRYMLLKTIMSALTGGLIALWLFLLGVDFPIPLGVVAFALNYIPNIGSVVAAMPGILLALIEFGLGTSFVTALGYVAINVGVSNGIEPRFMGYGLGLSPLVVLTSVIFWGWVLGPLGMLLSVPLTMTLKIALESDEHSRWIALLMGSRPRRKARAYRRLLWRRRRRARAA